MDHTSASVRPAGDDRTLSRRLKRILPFSSARQTHWDVIAASAWRRAPLVTAQRTLTGEVRRRIPSLSRTTVRIHHGGAKCTVRLTSFLGLALYRYGFEEPEVELLYRLLQPGDRFVDAGAHIGLFTLIAASRVGPTGTVVAMEPARQTFQELRANVEVNGYHWVDLVPAAVGASPGTATLTSFTGDRSALSSLSPAHDDGGSREEVRLDTIDDLVHRLGQDRVVAMKIDVEGSEVEAVKGAASVLRDCRPEVLIEVEPDHLTRQGATVGDLRACFDDLGYRSFRVGPGPVLAEDRTWTMPWRTPNVFLTVRADQVRSRLAGADPGR